MGRGRQKAKQTKIARDLKYYSPPTDLSALQRELSSNKQSNSGSNSSYEDDLYEDKWADQIDDWDDEED